MKIYLVRHGECQSNALGRYNYIDEDINETGIKQSKELRKTIKKINYEIIIASPLKRTVHTAELINAKEKEIITDERLVERNPGTLEGKSLETTNREDYWNYYTNNRYGTEERIPDLCKRINNFLDELKTKDYKNVLIVAHSGVSKAFYVYFNGIPKDGKLLNFGLKNAELIEYELEN